MSAVFDAEEIIEITEGRVAQGMLPNSPGRISTDTRNLSPGDWYLALTGERFDGHDFLADAFAGGATGAIVAARGGYSIADNSFPLIVVPDTKDAYAKLARNWRRRISAKVVGITGSSGKTTTKEMCAAAVAAGFAVHKSSANENNEIGVPKTILSMPPDTKVLIIEMAMRARGEILTLAQTALPDIGIIVNVGMAHLGPLANFSNIVEAKCELLQALDPRHGLAIIGKPNPKLMSKAKEVYSGSIITFADYDLQEVQVTPDTTTFIVVDLKTKSQSSAFTVHAHGLSLLQDAWCAIVCGRALGLDDQTIAHGLKAYRPGVGRGQRLYSTSGAMIIDESYNGNPDSVQSSVSTFVDCRAYPQSTKYVVLGELAELGPQSEQLHRDLGQWMKGQKLTGLLTVGPIAEQIAVGARGASFDITACVDLDDVENKLKSRLNTNASVLIKGSHCAHLERLVAKLASSNC